MVIFPRCILAHERLLSTCLVVAMMVLALAITAMPTQAIAQESMDRSDRYTSIRGSIYKKTLRRLDEHGYGARFKLQLSTTIYRYKSLDDLLNP